MSNRRKMIICDHCGEKIASTAKTCPYCGGKVKKPLFQRWWFWVIVVLIVIGAVSGGSGGLSSDSTPSSHSSSDASVVRSSSENMASASMAESIASDLAEGLSTLGSQSAEPAGGTEEKVPAEYRNALKKAEQYSSLMHMSKQGIYNQLVSEYGEKFPEDAAQYAIDNMQADWNANALAKAKDYQELMSMSKSAIYDQLISEYGERFTPEEAQYAIDHLE